MLRATVEGTLCSWCSPGRQGAPHQQLLKQLARGSTDERDGMRIISAWLRCWDEVVVGGQNGDRLSSSVGGTWC